MPLSFPPKAVLAGFADYMVHIALDKGGNWFLHYSTPAGHNRSPVDKDGLDLTFVNMQMLCMPNEDMKQRGGLTEITSAHPWLLFFFCRQNKLAPSSDADFLRCAC